MPVVNHHFGDYRAKLIGDIDYSHWSLFYPSFIDAAPYPAKTSGRRRQRQQWALMERC